MTSWRVDQTMQRFRNTRNQVGWGGFESYLSSTFTNPKLRTLCGEFGIGRGGKRADLIERIAEECQRRYEAETSEHTAHLREGEAGHSTNCKCDSCYGNW